MDLRPCERKRWAAAAERTSTETWRALMAGEEEVWRVWRMEPPLLRWKEQGQRMEEESLQRRTILTCNR
jgi:hypothetical protein